MLCTRDRNPGHIPQAQYEVHVARATTPSLTTGRILILAAFILAGGSCNPEHAPTAPRNERGGSPLAAVASGVVANPGGPYSGAEGTAITFDGSLSTGTGLRYNWDFGDATPHDTSGPTPTHAYADNKNFTVKLFVTDANGVKSATAQTTAAIANVPPVLADLVAPALSPRAGLAFTLSTTFTDAGTADTHSGAFAWGDGKSNNATVKESAGSGTVSGSHSYAAAGTYALSLRLTDDNGGADTAKLTLVVGPKNRPPKANPGGPYTGVEGSPVSFDGTGSTDPDGDALKYDWDFGDASPHDTTATPSHVYVKNGTFTVKLFVTDSYGAKSTTAQTTATIANAAPVIVSFTGPANAPVAGTATTVQASFTDGGTADTHTAAFDWGDATSSAGTVKESGGSGTVTGTHTFTAAGQYTVRLRLSDNGGGADTATLDLTVAPSSQVGSLSVTTTTSGSDLDPDGYSISVDGGGGQAIGINATISIANLSVGSHTVALSGQAGNCTVTSANPQTVSITAGATTSSTFAVSCSPVSTNGGAIAVSASTIGQDLDADGYTLFLDSTSSQPVVKPVGANGSATFTSVNAGAHTVTIGGLASNCSIGISSQTVSVASGATSQLAFTVFCIAQHASSYTLVGAGDIADCARTDDEVTGDTLAAIVAREPGAVVYTIGDNVYDASTATELADCYEPNWGRQKARTFATLGNHEYNIDPSPTWDYFGTHAGPRGLGYYSYNLGDYWHVIVLNDNASYGGPARTAGSPQDQWLQADLAANTRPCIIAMWHQPFVASDNWYSASRKIYWDRLYAARADIVLNGHLHTYEREYPQTPDLVRDDANGILQFIVGTGGASTYTADTLRVNTAVVAPSRGVLKLTLGPGSYSWEFVWAKGQTFTDSGSGTCH